MYVAKALCGTPAATATLLATLTCLSCGLAARTATAQSGNLIRSQGVIERISEESERLEITTNTSRILTLGTRIPRIQVNNPDLLSATALSATEVQISAKKPGVTSINLWDENDKVYTVDILIYGDARELELALKTQFPNSNVRVYQYEHALVLTGFVDRPDYISQIMRLAEDYSPKVVNNISVGGVHQVLLNVKVMEVSRTKLRRLGFDFAQLSSSGGFIASGVSGLLASVSQTSVVTNGAETLSFGITSGNDVFFGFLDALEQNDLLKILADPVLTTVSGRPAQFNVGGEFPIIVPQSLGTVSIEYKKFGTQVDFLPIVLGNGNIRLEVRPRVSEIDPTRSVVVNNTTVPGLRVREIDTAVEMKAGQTLALAGLVQQRTEAQYRGLPVVGRVPYAGALFRRVEEVTNEIELLILVTPEYVEAMDPHEVPSCGPGMSSTSPSGCELYFDGYLEVPKRPCGPGNGAAYGGPGSEGPGGFPGPMMGPAMPGEIQPGQDIVPPAEVVEPPAGAAPAVDGAAARQGRGLSVAERPSSPSASGRGGPGLIGPIGYDAQ